MGQENKEEEYSPYCPICSGCGEDGCCAATCCQMDPKGQYCESYLKDLQFAYLMYRDMYELIDSSHKEEHDRVWDKNYEAVYERKVNREQIREELQNIDAQKPTKESI